MVTGVPEELVSCRYLEDGSHVTPGPHRNHQLPNGDAEDFVEVVVDAHSVELGVGRPFDQFDYDIDAFAFANRRDAEQILDVQNPQATHLNVVAQEICRLPKHHTRGPVVAFHDVVG